MIYIKSWAVAQFRIKQFLSATNVVWEKNQYNELTHYHHLVGNLLVVLHWLQEDEVLR